MSGTLLERVRERILCESSFNPVWIKQDLLAREFGISKIPLREALRRLEREGLVSNEPNRGFFTTPLTPRELEEIFALRLKLEPDAAAEAARNADEAERAHASAAFTLLRRETAARGPRMGDLNRHFHMALLHPAGTPITAEVVERLYVCAERYVRKHLEPSGRSERANEEHAGLLSAWLARDAKSVRMATAEHISRTVEDLRRQLHAKS